MAAKRRKKRAHRLGWIEREILEELSAGDLFYGFLWSARSTRRMFKLARQHANQRYQRKLAIERLKENRFIEEKGKKLSITQAGRSAIGTVIVRTAALLEKSDAWDGKWRIVIFDIPEKYHVLRDKIRAILKRAGFVQLQQSAWVFPYECHELVELLQQESDLSRHILYGVLEQIGNDAQLREMFNLD
jgi:phenylacetic acid degradation operon negative regulatory protein